MTVAEHPTQVPIERWSPEKIAAGNAQFTDWWLEFGDLKRAKIAAIRKYNEDIAELEAGMDQLARELASQRGY